MHTYYLLIINFFVGQVNTRLFFTKPIKRSRVATFVCKFTEIFFQFVITDFNALSAFFSLKKFSRIMMSKYRDY